MPDIFYFHAKASQQESNFYQFQIPDARSVPHTKPVESYHRKLVESFKVYHEFYGAVKML